MSFTSLGLSPYLAKALTAQNHTKPYPIQEAAIPAILKGKDILGIAQTGSGKTASYVLPTLMNLEGKTATKNRHINVLVLVPTRELAIQVEEVFRVFGKALPFPFKSFAVYGGVSINPQMIGLQNVNVLVATPGRLLELSESNALHLSSVSTLILDEADKMLNLGFKAEMDRIFALLPKKRQNLLFSATLSPDVENVERVLLNDPLVINIAPKEENLDLINQLGYFVNEEKKGPLLRYLIKKSDMQQVLVFTSSTARADAVADKLHHNGIPARAIHSKKSQGNRKASLEQFKAGKLRVLVATDLLSRGIDIEFLPYVINYELPRSPKDFVHRIGRTGRAENPGQAITLITPDDKHHFKVIQKKMKKAVTMIDSENLEDFK
ncbi:DEAD/DEAH box helicase [Owenweeksia hongkongensis]|uniref:DEAD/DEAH box helicase n=1 Tax=Owenweeksia hongkongensis TaxID=253245 RepID=UPI003A8E78CD